jgi:hypothetical protein
MIERDKTRQTIASIAKLSVSEMLYAAVSGAHLAAAMLTFG